MNVYYVGDIGVDLVTDCGFDVSQAAALSLQVKLPNKSIVTWLCNPYVFDSSPNWMLYTTKAGDLSQAGTYKVQALINLSADEVLYGETDTFVVNSLFK